MSDTSTHPVYLTAKIVESKVTGSPRYGLTRDGYSVRSGAPSVFLIRLLGEKRFRRVMVWQFSNAGTAFVRINGIPHIVRHVPQCTCAAILGLPHPKPCEMHG